jgi:hypothetical protein
VDPEVWQIPQEYFSVDELPDTLLAFLKLLGKNFIPEIEATINLYHDWLDAEDRPAGSVVDAEGKKQCHQVLGPLEHLQMGISFNRIGLLDDVSHHLRFQALTDQMKASEKDTFRKVFQHIGAKDFADLRLKRNTKRQDYASVLA